MIVCAANPPGSLDLTYFFRSSVSGSASAVAVTTREEGVLGKGETERERDSVLAKERVQGLWEMWEEKESEEREVVSADRETAIVFLPLPLQNRSSTTQGCSQNKGITI